MKGWAGGGEREEARARQPRSTEGREGRLPGFPPTPKLSPRTQACSSRVSAAPGRYRGGGWAHTHVPQHACGGGTPAHPEGLASREVAAGVTALGGLPAERDAPRARTNRRLRTCRRAEASRRPGLCVPLPTAPPRAEASPGTHALTHPAAGSGQSLPLYLCDNDRYANSSRRGMGVNWVNSTTWHPQLPRETVPFSPKACPPLP